MSENENSLGLAEANQLVYALIAHIASKYNIPYIAVKGPALANQKLREPKISSDVDVIVSPKNFEKVSQELQSLGWKFMADKRDPAFQTLLLSHSSTFYHDSWPNHIDLHDEFPGVEVPTGEFIDYFLEDPHVEICASKKVLFPSRIKHAYIHLVHLIRGAPLSPPPSVDDIRLKFLADNLDEQDQKELLIFAKQVDGLAIIKDFYVHYYGDIPEFSWGKKPKKWKKSIAGFSSPGAMHIISILDAPLKEKPALLFRSILPEKSSTLSGTLQEHRSDKEVKKLRKERISRFRKSIKPTLKVVREYYTDDD
ncbi:MAG: nucleotidyltransferase family protein [Micrococcaceae bacterium]